MGIPSSLPCLLAVADAAVRQRVSSRLVDGLDEWWQPVAAVAAVAALVAFVVWMVRRDAAELPVGVRLLLAALRLVALGAVVTALLDVERVSEREVVLPSRVAVLVDSSASMSLPESATSDGGPTRTERALEILEAGGLLAALGATHEVSLWRFDADAEPILTLPAGERPGEGAAAPPDHSPAAPGDPVAGRSDDWRLRLAAGGYETRLGEALEQVLDREPAGSLAGIVLLSDGAGNAGIDPLAAAAALAKAGVAVQPVGIGGEELPVNVRVADLLVPARVFPGDRFAVTAYLQPQGLEGTTVRVELVERPGDGGEPTAGDVRVIDTVEARLAADGGLVPVRFDVPGLQTAGSRTLVVRVAPPAGDRATADDEKSAPLEVVDRVTQVLLMAAGPGREYQFMRNVLDRDPSFAVDVLLGTAAAGMSQDARRILAGFPDSDAALAEYDAVVAIDFDWRSLDPPALARLERWVARDSGGLLLYAGGIHTEACAGDPRCGPVRGLFPVEVPRGSGLGVGASGEQEPMPLEFTRDGEEAEFLWLAGSPAASREVWREFAGIYACYPAEHAKPGGTVYARVRRGGTAGGTTRIALAGQFYGSGSVLFVGSAELWRLRAVADAAYERLVAQCLRHVSQGRLARGGRRARLLVDRDRHPVGGSVQVRVVLADAAAAAAAAARPPVARAVGPDGMAVPVTLTAVADSPEALTGGFVAVREGAWRIEVDAGTGVGDEPLARTIQAQLPDRELARPRLDRGLLEQLAARTDGTARFPAVDGWSDTEAAAVAAALPDRSRREYETGAADLEFKRRLNMALLSLGCGCLCLEWIVRRLAKLA